MVGRAKNDLVNRYIKDGKDQSDFYRGFIVAIEQVLMLKESFKTVDNLRNIAKGGK